MHLTTLTKRRDRGDLITIHKLRKQIGMTWYWVKKGEVKNLREHKKLQKGICLNDTKKYSFPQRSIDTWNGMKEEVIMAKNVHQLKEKLDKYRNGNRTIRV